MSSDTKQKSPWAIDEATVKQAARMGFNEFQLSMIATGLETVCRLYEHRSKQWKKSGNPDSANIFPVTIERTKEIYEAINMELHGVRSMEEFRQKHFSNYKPKKFKW